MNLLVSDFKLIIRIVLLLIFTINASNYELYPDFNDLLNKNIFMRILSLFMLTLGFIWSIKEKLNINSFFVAFISTFIFIIIAKPYHHYPNLYSSKKDIIKEREKAWKL